MRPAACTSRWEPPHLYGGRSASALREKLDFNQCALALGSQNRGAKAHSRIERPFCWTRVQLPPAKAGGSHQKAVARVAHIVRPTAGAIIRNCSISSANCCGYSDCAPSDSASSGEGCTSISNASAPAATDAHAIGATLSRNPVPCEGSEVIGKCHN